MVTPKPCNGGRKNRVISAISRGLIPCSFSTGRLTAVRLEGTERAFVFTRPEGAGFVVDSAKPND